MFIDPSTRYYFYQSAIGSLERIVLRNVVEGIQATSGFLTNAFGVKVCPAYLPEIIGNMGGVEPPPIPSNWHSDLAEFGAALFAVELAKDTFTVVELGCGWGCWLNITGLVAKRRGLDVRLIGVEGDAGHVSFAFQSLQENGFETVEYVIHHGIASAESGFALFPNEDKSGVDWGMEAIYDLSETDAERLLETGLYTKLDRIALPDLLPSGQEYIDLLHVDIQGAEVPLLPLSMPFLNDKVAMVLVGTHSKKIESELFDCFLSAGWVLDVERPIVLNVGRNLHTLVDGVQLWRNPRLRPDHELPLCDASDYSGSLYVVSSLERVAADSEFWIDVNIVNLSGKVWVGTERASVRLSYHWIGRLGEVVVHDGIRTEIKGGFVKPNSSVMQQIRVLSPWAPGCYVLRISLVEEGVCWFEDKGFSCGEVTVLVE
jgi:hypothetical protein